jgi:ferredoxin-NADP reductase
LTLKDIVKHNEDTYSFDFDIPKGFNWVEGDSSKLYIKDLFGELGKVFSYATLPNEAIVRFTTRIREERSHYKNLLSKVAIGSSVEVTPPKGDFKLRRHNQPIIIASNGVGIAATRSLIKAYEENSFGIPKLVQINIDKKNHIYKDEFRDIMNRKRNFMSLFVSSRESYYQMLDHEIQRVIMKEPNIYIVGSDNFVIDTYNHLKDMGIDEQKLITEGHVFGGCGCSSSEGCGCGSNIVSLENEKDLNEAV